ncbi:hypothetical protein, partial [Rhizobium leguminosarum]|uniref:hypothetical protein n=1 Tax=Rhizobium leguminosarum TaxID=384 RepID=UPI00197F2C03
TPRHNHRAQRMQQLLRQCRIRFRQNLKRSNPEGVPISNRQACNRGCDEELDNRRDLSAINGEIGIGCIGKIVVPCHLLIAVEAGH